MAVKKLVDLSLAGKRLLIRQDLNVPIDEVDGVRRVSSDQRILAALPTIKYAVEQGAHVMVMSHLGRPVEGEPDSAFSLQPVATHMEKLLGQSVRLVADYLENAVKVGAGEVVLLENVRFNVGEKSDNEKLSQQYADLCDIYVMDAFGTAHRAQASTHGVGLLADEACAGPLLSGELEALEKALDNPARPLLAIVGGSKVSTKLTVLETLAGKVDQLIVGGGIANTFIAALGHNVGKSLYEADLVDEANRLMAAAKERGADIPVPADVVCGLEFDENTPATLKAADEVTDADMIFDIGPATAEQYASMIATAGTILWNGPVGVFEFEQFGEGTRSLANAIADSEAFSIAGGGDTLAAVDKYDIADKVSYISTGGGAFLEFLEGKVLPAVAMLEKRSE